MKLQIALIIVFNHRYDQNIKILETIYNGRFTNIYFLVPFYDGDKENVISVYGNSYYYSKLYSSGLQVFFKEEYSHYFLLLITLKMREVVSPKLQNLKLPFVHSNQIHYNSIFQKLYF